jgi:hypothetical protein
MDTLVAEPALLAHAGCHLRRALRRARRVDEPFRHWLPSHILPPPLCAAIAALPFPPPAIADTLGRRETHNHARIFVSPERRRRHGACEALAEAFQDPATVALLGDLCGTALDGSFLRIECCLDTGGFWLEPHTDIGAKLFTMLVYLSDHPDAAAWGTDIMDAGGRVLGRAPGTFNDGLVFVPGPDTWHGFTRRDLRGVRRSVIVNYVKPEWRSRHELAYPETPVTVMTG